MNYFIKINNILKELLFIKFTKAFEKPVQN